MNLPLFTLPLPTHCLLHGSPNRSVHIRQRHVPSRRWGPTLMQVRTAWQRELAPARDMLMCPPWMLRLQRRCVGEGLDGKHLHSGRRRQLNRCKTSSTGLAPESAGMNCATTPPVVPCTGGGGGARQGRALPGGACLRLHRASGAGPAHLPDSRHVGQRSRACGASRLHVPAETAAQQANKTALPAYLARAPNAQEQQCNATRLTQTRSLPSPGDEALFQASAGPLDVMGKAKFFLGEVGAGANMKLVRVRERGLRQHRWPPPALRGCACAGLRKETSAHC